MKATQELKRTLHNQHGRLTPQRRLVLEILEQSEAHMDAGAIFEEARRRGANISLATIYRSLTLLKQAGVVEESHLGEEHHHYEATPAAPHYHFTCRRCGRVIEFQAEEIGRAVQALSRREGLRVDAIQLDLSGECAECQAGAPARPSTP